MNTKLRYVKMVSGMPFVETFGTMRMQKLYAASLDTMLKVILKFTFIIVCKLLFFYPCMQMENHWQLLTII